MLKRLALRRFVFIQETETEFSDGFCALTGETGAGKSLLVDALSLLAGARPTAGMNPPGKDGFEIEAVFDVSDCPAASDFLAQNELCTDEQEMIARRVGGEKKSKAFINGRQTPLSVLAEAVSLTADICGQNAHYSLRKPSAQRAFVDEFGGSEDAAAQTAQAHREWSAAHATLQSAREDAGSAKLRTEQLQEEIAELESAGFSEQKWQEQNRLLTRLSHVQDLAEGGATALQDLEQGAAKLSEARRRLRDLSKLDSELAAPAQCAEEAETAANEAAHALSRLAENLHTEPAAQQEAEAFVAEAHRLARKYQLPDPANLSRLLAEKQSELASLTSQTDIAALEKTEKKLHASFIAACGVLSKKRSVAGKDLQKKTNSLLSKLAMPDARLHVNLEKLDSPGAHGAERVELEISTRKDAPPGALADVASGGELSRLGLALQIAAGGRRAKPVIVFDEVDAGVGGAAASEVGRLLQTLGQTRQVLCVTHLAQVAAHADSHWRVLAQTQNGSRAAKVEKLSLPGRIEEIARIVGGAKINDAARANAEDLLEQSRRKQEKKQ